MSPRYPMLAVAALCILIASPASAKLCTRLPLSDVAFGKLAATEAARIKLAEYAGQTLRKRGWPGKGALKSSNEIVSCKIYLDLGPLGTEYRCLVTATYCAK
jgi:hypothetical protein